MKLCRTAELFGNCREIETRKDMRQGVKLTFEEKKEKVISICEMYANDRHTIEDCCRAFGVESYQTFKNWVDEFGEFGELYKNAQAAAENVYFERLKQKARTALEKKIEGYDVELVETTIGEKGTTVKTVQKHFNPSDTAIIFALTNKDPENFRNKHNVEIEDSEGLRKLLAGLSVNELAKLKTISANDAGADTKRN